MTTEFPLELRQRRGVQRKPLSAFAVFQLPAAQIISIPKQHILRWQFLLPFSVVIKVMISFPLVTADLGWLPSMRHKPSLWKELFLAPYQGP